MKSLRKEICLKKFGLLFSRYISWFWNILPWSYNRYFAQFLSYLWIDVLNIRRDVIYGNLEIVFPGMPDEKKYSIAKKSMFALCRSFADVIRIPYLTDKWIDDNVIFEGQRNINEIKSSDSGVFFLSLHLGSGDIAAAVISERIVPTTIISKRFKNRFLDSFWFGLRERSKTLFIDAHSKNNAFEILSAIKKKRGVVFVMDQFMGKPFGIESPFFGVLTGTAYGLAIFAKKTRKPVYPLYTYWDENNKLHICVDEAIDLSQELSEDNLKMINKFNNVLEKIILRFPEQWMWVHKRWKNFHD